MEDPAVAEATSHADLTAGQRSIKDVLFYVGMLASLGIAFTALVALIALMLVQGWPRLNLDLITHFPSSIPARAGAESAVLGSIWVVGFTALFTIPLGVAAAVYLEEFADKQRWYNRLIELNIQNLAAVPSIVYGILGLGLIVQAAGLGQVVLAASLTLTLLVLPTVIIAAREAIRAVPDSIRAGSLALGATQWQTVWRQVLPASVPGIATGVILALSRAIGEAAPLVLLGGLTFIQFNPSGLDSPFTVLPIQIFNWVSRPQDEFEVLAAAAGVVLLVILLAMNSIAILVRNRFQRRW
ncbi:phosphate ABC transporter permease PstA [Frankia nepalensis]|uniref:phosphate ABC transporter permease PstA n=1 Tax=Frankia nepalensis TaxID=1836974 RepID=UPI003898F894